MPERFAHSRAAIGSFVVAMVMVLCDVVASGVFVSMYRLLGTHAAQPEAASFVYGSSMLVGALFWPCVILGAVGVLQRRSKRIFAFMGVGIGLVAVSLAMLFVLCLLFGWGQL